MPWIVKDGGSRYGMTYDNERCEWVNVSSDTSSPSCPGQVQRAIKWL